MRGGRRLAPMAHRGGGGGLHAVVPLDRWGHSRYPKVLNEWLDGVCPVITRTDLIIMRVNPFEARVYRPKKRRLIAIFSGILTIVVVVVVVAAVVVAVD